MRWYALVSLLLLAGCVHDQAQHPHQVMFKGHCLRGELGGHDYVNECTGYVLAIDYPSGISSLIFPLTGDRKAVFISGGEPDMHKSNMQWIAMHISLVSGSKPQNFDMSGAMCNWTLQNSTPQYIECAGQAGGQSAFFSFQVESQVPDDGQGAQ